MENHFPALVSPAMREAKAMESLKLIMNGFQNERERAIQAGLTRRVAAAAPMYPSAAMDHNLLGAAAGLGGPSPEELMLAARIQQEREAAVAVRRERELQLQQLQQHRSRQLAAANGVASLATKLANINGGVGGAKDLSSVRLCDSELSAAASKIAQSEMFMLEEQQRAANFKQEQMLLNQLEHNAQSLPPMNRQSSAAEKAAEPADAGAAVGSPSKPSAAAVASTSSGSSIDSKSKFNVLTALHSNPQRGRKRKNLTAAERAELTRSRNREHAKSTRARKKKRFDELEICEAQLNTMMSKEVQHERRVECFQNFLAARQQMLNAAVPFSLGNNSNNPGDDSNTKTNNTEDCRQEKSDAWACEMALKDTIAGDFRFVHTTIPFVTTGSGGIDKSNESVTPDKASSEPTAGASAAILASGGQKVGSKSPLACMRMWDQQLRLRILESDIDGTPVSPSSSSLTQSSMSDIVTGRQSTDAFVYEIEDGIDGITLNNNSTIGFAQVDLVLYKKTRTDASELTSEIIKTEKRTVLLKMMLKFRFKKDPSHLLSSVDLTVLEDCCGLLRPIPASSKSVRAFAVAVAATSRELRVVTKKPSEVSDDTETEDGDSNSEASMDADDTETKDSSPITTVAVDSPPSTDKKPTTTTLTDETEKSAQKFAVAEAVRDQPTAGAAAAKAKAVRAEIARSKSAADLQDPTSVVADPATSSHDATCPRKQKDSGDITSRAPKQSKRDEATRSLIAAMSKHILPEVVSS